MGSALALAGVNYVVALMRVLPERDPHEAVYEAASLIADALDDGALAPALIARFEAQILAQRGFLVHLSSCAVTGVHPSWSIHHSPPSRGGVSAEALARPGAIWAASAAAAFPGARPFTWGSAAERR